MKLISTLKTVIDALKKDIVQYDWVQPESCNCGLIAQAILQTTPKKLEAEFNKLSHELKTPLEKDDKDKTGCLTWRQIAQRGCSVTGLSDYQILTSLKEGGLRAEDIVHLEYMQNKAILEEAKIDTTIKDYYQSKKNLVLYLEAWVRILESKTVTHTKTDKKVDIERSLLKAVGEENYEKAAELRDLLVSALN